MSLNFIAKTNSKMMIYKYIHAFNSLKILNKVVSC